MGSVGYTRNKAISQSSGDYLCLQDSVSTIFTTVCTNIQLNVISILLQDDLMLENRILLQYQQANEHTV